MRHLTNLILALSNYRFGAFNISNLYFPALRALDISGNDAPTGLVPFVAKHTSLHILHLHFDYGPLPAPFQDQDLLDLRALMMSARNTGVFGTFLSKRSESEEETCARRPHLDHLRIYNVDSLHYLLAYVQPLGKQLRRLDLHFLIRKPVFEDGFSTFLASLTALVELSITLRRRADIMTISGPHAQALSEAQLRTFLHGFKDCASLKALHFHDEETLPLHADDLENLLPVPPSIEFISWGRHSGKQAFRIVHDLETGNAYGVPFDLNPPENKQMVVDWTSENTFGNYFTQ